MNITDLFTAEEFDQALHGHSRKDNAAMATESLTRLAPILAKIHECVVEHGSPNGLSYTDEYAVREMMLVSLDVAL